MEKVDPLLNLTPALLTRLKALQGLHSEAATFSQSVKVISEEQVRITDELKSLASTCDLVSDLPTGFIQNEWLLMYCKIVEQELERK